MRHQHRPLPTALIGARRDVLHVPDQVLVVIERNEIVGFTPQFRIAFASANQPSDGERWQHT